jgi:tyrosyl-tRNA synthetase
MIASSVRQDEPTRYVLSGNEKWSQVLAYLGAIESISEGDRIIKQRGLEINGLVITNPTAKLNSDHAATYDLRIGKKKFLRIVVE